MILHHRRHDRAFTLIELLLALLIFSIISVVVYSVFNTGIQLSRRSEGRVEVYREARSSLELIKGELENMVPYDFSLSYPDKKAFLGDEDEVSFIVPIDGKLKRVRYALVSSQDGSIHQTIIGTTSKRNVRIELLHQGPRYTYVLVREEQDFADFLADKPLGDKNREVISANVIEGGLRFAYGFVEGENQVSYLWRDQWKAAVIPANVRIELKLLDPEKKDSVITSVQHVLIPHGAQGTSENSM